MDTDGSLCLRCPADGFNGTCEIIEMFNSDYPDEDHEPACDIFWGEND